MRYLLFLILLPTAGVLSAQDLAVFEAFTDHAVLQRDVDHPIWGWDRKNRKVTVTLDGEATTVKTDRHGRWTASLPATAAGGPHTIEIADGRRTITLEDIYFGDVYLLSGQSNMEWRLSQSDPDSSRAQNIADPLIRQILVAKTAADETGEHLELDEPWKPGTAAEIADFSGVGSYFAHYLREGGVDVPIGLVHSSWGGSRIEPWLPAAQLGEADRKAAADRHEQGEKQRAEALQRYRQTFGEAPPAMDLQTVNQAWLADDADDAEWPVMDLPGLWEANGYPNVDGVFYFRRAFELTESQAREAATLHLGPIDDGDLTYVNGREVGRTPNAYAEPRVYTLPAGTLRTGANTLALRVVDTGGGGGAYGAADELYLETSSGERIPLSGPYRYRIGAFSIGQDGANQVPTLLYNAMIAPLRNWPLTGVLWYQGESNAGATDAPRYAEQMRGLIGAWRDQFDAPALPFYWVQLANFMAPTSSPDEPGWALLRDQQTAALDVAHTGQAIITDIGEAGDIHPKNKWEVGRRLSLHALKDIYGQDVQASSPVADRLEPGDGGTATVTFRETGKGLTLHGVDAERYPFVRSLAVRGGDGEWLWAVGSLDTATNRLTVVHPHGESIEAVRYGWSNNPDDANLFSVDGLPVTPFELSTGGKR